MIKPNIEIVNVEKSCETSSQIFWNKVGISDPEKYSIMEVFIDNIYILLEVQKYS